MRRFNILTLMMGATIALTACSAKDDAILGSRDDIIIMNNGVPVGGTNVASAPEAMTTPFDLEMVENGADALLEASDVPDEAMAQIDADLAATEKAVVEAEKELAEVGNVAEEAAPVVAEAKANEAMASTEQVVEEITEVAMSTPTEAMTSAAPVIPMSEAPQAVETPLQSTVPVEEAIAEVTPEKVADGCYKQTLIPAVIDASGKVTELPKVEERRIVCLNKMNDGLVAIVQKALMGKGYNIKNADGVLGSKTSAALESYQRQNGLGLGGFTYETLESLGIKL